MFVLDSNQGDKADTLIVGQYPNIGDKPGFFMLFLYFNKLFKKYM